MKYFSFIFKKIIIIILYKSNKFNYIKSNIINKILENIIIKLLNYIIKIMIFFLSSSITLIFHQNYK